MSVYRFDRSRRIARAFAEALREQPPRPRDEIVRDWYVRFGADPAALWAELPEAEREKWWRIARERVILLIGGEEICRKKCSSP